MISTYEFEGMTDWRKPARLAAIGLFAAASVMSAATIPAISANAKTIYLSAKSCDAKVGFSALGFASGKQFAADTCHDFQVVPDEGGWAHLQLSGTDLVLKTKACQGEVGYDVVGVGPRATGADASCDLWRLVPVEDENGYGFLQSKQSFQFLEINVDSHGAPTAFLHPWGEGLDYDTVCRYWRPKDAGNGAVQLALEPTPGDCKARLSSLSDPGQDKDQFVDYWKKNWNQNAPLEQAKKDAGGEEFKHEGKTYGWYDVGWKGPGFYVVDSSELEFGGGKGWNGWVHHDPHPTIVDGVPH